MNMATIDMTIKHEGLVLDVEVGNVYSKLLGDLPKIVEEALDESLSYYVEGYQFSKLHTDGWWDQKTQAWKFWDGKKHLLYAGRGFNTGLLERVQEVLATFKINTRVLDRRKPVPFGKELVTKNFEHRDYQQRALQAALYHKGGIVKVATGGGKSVILANLIAHTNVKTMVFVPSIDLLYQTKEMIEQVIGQDIGIIGDGEVDTKNITISTIWSASNALSKKLVKFNEEDFGRKERFSSASKQSIAAAVKAMELMIVDECHMTACQSLQCINSAAKNCRYKFGFSGTPNRGNGEDLLVEGVLGRKIIDIPASELIGAGYLVKPTIHFINIPESTEDPGNTYQSVYKNYIVENEVRNQRILETALTLKEAGRKTLILVRNIKHGERLLELFEDRCVIYFVRGELDSDERNTIRKNFIKGKIDIIIASAVYDQGIDIKNLDALILAGSGKSPGRALQRIGRVIRPAKDKQDAMVIDFIDNAKYLYNHSLKRLETYRLEDGFGIKLPKDWNEEKDEYKERKKQVPKKTGGGPLPW